MQNSPLNKRFIFNYLDKFNTSILFCTIISSEHVYGGGDKNRGRLAGSKIRDIY